MRKLFFSILILFQIFAFKLFAQKDTIVMRDMTFEPASLTINAGEKVVWINRSGTDHTSTSGANCVKDGKWNSGYLSEGQSFSYTFNSPGSYNYFCIPHCLSGMEGVIVVKEDLSKEKNLKKKDEEQPKEPKGNKKTAPDFKGLDIINAVTAKTLGKGVLDFTMYHRFDNLIGDMGGPQVLFGLDNMRDVRLSLAYGLLKNITLGLGRSKGDWFNAPYQEVKNLYDGSVKVRMCSQDTGKRKIPFSITAYVNTVYSAMKNQNVEDSEANFEHFTDRFSHSCQVVVAHAFSKYIALQLMPVYLRRNWVNTCPEIRWDELDIFALGGGAKWQFSKRFSILAEYFYVFSDYRQKNKDVFSNPLAVGVEVNTGGHVFHINLSNSTGIIPNTFIPYTTSSWLEKGFRLGFSISRSFTLTKKSDKTN